MALEITRLALASLRGVDGNEWPVHGFLVRFPGGAVLVDTGAGGPQRWLDDWRVVNRSVADALDDLDMTPGDISLVINTHLHFDHCGGNTRIANDKVVPTFRNARYVVQRGEFEHAKNPTERDRASYFPDNFMPLEAAGKLSLIGDDRVIAPGVELIRTPGHNADMMCVRLHGGGKVAFLFDDLIPMTTHLSLPWIMGYDLCPLQTLENKKKWIPQVVQGEWLALFVHDPHVPAAYLREREGKIEVEPAKVD